VSQPTSHLHAAVDAALASIRDGGFRPQSERRLTNLVQSAANWLDRNGLTSVNEIDRAAAQSFITSPTTDGRSPSAATMHLRRSGLRLVFRSCRALEVCDSDPTIDLTLPSRSGLGARPLTDDEILVCRGAALGSLTDTRIPAAWALAEATATTSEIPLVVAADLSDDCTEVHLPGSLRRDQRVGTMSNWGSEQLQRRIRLLGRVNRPLIYAGEGGGESAQAATCKAVHQVLVRAGFASDTDVRPSSVAGWAGRRIWSQTGRIEEVARGLGLRSLDRASQVICWDWRETG
jgi:integrase/recombinase XerC